MIAAVIGANFGDEGKGLVTDYLSTPETLVVRFNGGAQAGHTVVTPDGQRHVFGHVGSGTFRGAKTLLSRFFLVNPFLFEQERAALHALGVPFPVVYVDPMASVTTPFDMLLNQAVERARGSGRHGSCGLGINETVTRSLDPRYALPAWALLNMAAVRQKLQLIAEEWAPVRAGELKVPVPEVPPGMLDAFCDAVDRFALSTRLQPDTKMIAQHVDHLVFEGAQGLGLDEGAKDFPYVTRSRTGITNVRTLLEAAHVVHPMVAYYVTRPYLTRHGAGPLAHEVSGHPFGWTGPETNRTNEFQGAFRYAPFDAEGLVARVEQDWWMLAPITQRLVVTCLDQTPGVTPQDIAARTGLSVALASYGPTRADVVPVERSQLLPV